MKTTILAFVLSATLAVASTSGPIGGPIGSPIQGPCGHGHGEAAPHVINIQSFGGNTGAISWSGGTATFIYNDAVTMPSSISNLESGSDPLLACSVGAQVWEDASTFNYVDGGTSTVTDVGTDSINLITFQNTMANTMAVGGALAVTLTSFNSALDIVEADIIFNPATNFSTLGSASLFDLQSVACHEFGHAFGLNHTAVCSATMFPFSGAGDTHQRSLSTDDIAGINGLYQKFDHFWSTGVITGSVMRNGSATYGAHIVARSVVDDTVQASALSKPDGTYVLSGLPVGIYSLYAEPLDGPVADANISNGTFYLTGKDTTFQTTDLGTTVRVRKATVTPSIDFTLPIANSTLNLTLVGESAGPGQGFSVNSGGFELAPGTSTFIVVAGQGVSGVADSGFSMPGAGITFGPASVQSGSLGGSTFKMFPLIIANDAPAGPRDIIMFDGSERAIFSGVIDVSPQSTPSATSVAYGVGAPATAGAPSLSTVGQPSIGNNAFGVTVSNGVNGETVFFYAAAAPDFIDLGNGNVQWIAIPPNLFPGTVFSQSIVGGSATQMFAIPNVAGLAGYQVYVQAALSDGAFAPGFSASNALRLTLN